MLPTQEQFRQQQVFTSSLHKLSILNERLNITRFSTTNKVRAPVNLMSPSYLLRSNAIFHFSIYTLTFARLEAPEST